VVESEISEIVHGIRLLAAGQSSLTRSLALLFVRLSVYLFAFCRLLNVCACGECATMQTIKGGSDEDLLKHGKRICEGRKKIRRINHAGENHSNNASNKMRTQMRPKLVRRSDNKVAEFHL
jgi:hypothetical protein